MSRNLVPVREIVLYKHGVGFFVREGLVNAEQITLTFRHDEINDVLKSLAVFDRSGGQVLGIHYHTPMDKYDRLANSSIVLDDNTSLRDLIKSLRGRRVTMLFHREPSDDDYDSIIGRVVGLDEAEDGHPQETTDLQTMVIMRTDDGQVKAFPLSRFMAVDIVDEQAEQDLGYFLDTEQGDDNRRQVTVRLSKGKHDLFVAYVAPSPTWRVSYRIVAETDENDKSKGRSLIQGWGLFDNRLEEDLSDVRVTLVAGQPISFIYDLYASRIPRRPTVQDEARVAPNPVQYEASLDWLASQGPVSTELGIPMEESSSDGVVFARAVSKPSLKQLETSVASVAQGRDADEFFEYVVTTPVSVKRGDSAMVPIMSTEVNYTRELLYNGRKLPNHPVASLRFDNTTDLTLERGPVTLVENGDYKGEAVIPFTKTNNDVYLPYAVELGVKVSEERQEETRRIGLNLRDEMIIHDRYEIYKTTYTVENTTDEPQAVTIEQNKQTGYDLYDTAPPFVQTTNERRWKVTVPEHTKTTFTVKVRRRMEHSSRLMDLNMRQLQDYLDNRFLDQETFNTLSEMLDNKAFIQRAQTTLEDIANRREKIYKQQENLRANISTLQADGPEADFRNRLLGQLEEAQNRLSEVDRMESEVRRRIDDAQKRVDEIVGTIGK